MKWPAHGANPRYIYESFQMDFPEEYIDFSMNVNPFGMPTCINEDWSKWLSVVSDYPDPKRQVLTNKLAAENGVTNDQILVGNGGAELISLIGNMLRKKRVVIVQPAFSEYEIACRANDCTISYHVLDEGDWQLPSKRLIDTLDGVDAEAVFLCTPNNPTGVVYNEAAILHVIRVCQQRQITVVIDEAFFDFYSTKRSYVHTINQYPNVIILRSLTKMYAIAGLRLGYVMAHPEIIKTLATYQPHWSVNGIALLAGEACLDAVDHVEKSVACIDEERVRLLSFFKNNNFTVSHSEVNFYILRDALMINHLPLFHFLLKKGIVPRHTANFPGLEGRWLRFAVKTAAENDVLLEALTEWRMQS